MRLQFQNHYLKLLPLSLAIMLDLIFTSLNFMVYYLWDAFIISMTIVQQLRNNAIYLVCFTHLPFH